MTAARKTLRLHFPQWQGGTLPAYHFGARLLQFLAPQANGPVEEIAVDEPQGTELQLERGIYGRAMLLRQAQAAKAAIAKHQPDAIVVLGGDCLVDLMPFAYLNERYNGELGVLWVDAHPDVMTPEVFTNAHAMVLGNLLGAGDAEFSQLVERPLQPERVMIAGLGKTSAFETAFLEKHHVATVGPQALAHNSEAVLDWIRRNDIRKLAIHFDVDVIKPSEFRSLYFADPAAAPGHFDGITQGDLSLAAVQRLLTDVGQHTDVVGLGIAEHLPWDAINLRALLAKLPLIGNS